MTLKQCTKDELIWLVNRIAQRNCYPNQEYEISRALNELSYEREKKRLDEAERWAKISHDKRMEYCELLKPYDGWKWIDIPLEVVNKCVELIKDAEAADKKWDELIGGAE